MKKLAALMVLVATVLAGFCSKSGKAKEINCCEIGASLAGGGANLKWMDKNWQMGWQVELNLSYYFSNNFGLRVSPGLIFIPLENANRLEIFAFPFSLLLNFQIGENNFLTFSPGAGFGRADLEHRYYYYQSYSYYYHYQNYYDYTINAAMGFLFIGSVEFKQRIANCVFVNFGLTFEYAKFENFPDLYFIAPKIGISAIW
ncbi:MAG: hypothetical protein AB1465_01955 [Patescibacteria group bacterium]